MCEEGPNILLYPQEIWFSEVTHEDLPAIVQVLDDFLNNEA
jgi:(2Fe-2S) ferredoxin